jgi:hypothetical protein
MYWTDEATELFAELVACLPSSLRPQVEEQAETSAERMSTERGREEIGTETALFALMDSTPMNMRGRLMEAMTFRIAAREVKLHVRRQEQVGRQTLDVRR